MRKNNDVEDHLKEIEKARIVCMQTITVKWNIFTTEDNAVVEFKTRLFVRNYFKKLVFWKLK